MWKINASIWFYCMEKMVVKDKRKDKAQRAHTRENQKAHATGEFIIDY